jgi:hypothetical protein
VAELAEQTWQNWQSRRGRTGRADVEELADVLWIEVSFSLASNLCRGLIMLHHLGPSNGLAPRLNLY